VLPLIVALVTLHALAGPGYLVQVDIAFGPTMPPLHWTFFTPVSLLLHLSQWAIGGGATGSLYVISALAAPGFGAMVLLRDKRGYTQSACGLLAMLNPFVYDRLVEGQWGVLFATGGLFLFVAGWLVMQRTPGIRTAAATTAAALFAVMFSPNFIGIVAAAAIALSLAATQWNQPEARRWTIAALVSSGALSAYGVIPFFTNHGAMTYESYQNVTTFSAADFAAFQSTPDPHFGVIAALAGLYGEWSERIGRYTVANVAYPWAVASTLVLFGLAVAGAWLRPSRAWLLPLGAVGIAVSAITSTRWGLQTVVSLAHHFPLLAAYREPQKWDVLWLLALVVLGAEAIERGSELLARPLRAIPAGPALAALMTIAAIAPAGFVQLRDTTAVVKPVTYPGSWYRAADYLRAHVPAGSPVVVLPWHLYESLPFVGHPSENPADVFFPGTLVISLDPEVPGTVPIDAIGQAAARRQGCALADAVRDVGSHWAVAFPDAADGEAQQAALQRCGFSAVLTPTADVAVLRDR